MSSSQRKHCARHTVEVAAPAGVVYGLLADAPRWPVLLPAYVHVERVDADAAGDRLRLWHLRGGRVRSVLARRALHPGLRRIEFEHRDPLAPGAPTYGSWNVSPDGPGRCLVTLHQQSPPPSGPPPGPPTTPGAPEIPGTPRAPGLSGPPEVPGAPVESGPPGAPGTPDAPGASGLADAPDVPGAPDAPGVLDASDVSGVSGVLDVFEARVRAEVAAVRVAAERWDRLDELLLSFEDSVYVCGSPEIVYDFLYRIGDWADLVPHVERVEVGEERPGVQRTVVHTSDPDTGDTAVFEGVRLCFPAAGRIVHRQSVTPDPIAAYYGEWSLEPDARGVRVAHRHQVMLRESAVEPAPGAGALPVDARRQVREWLGRTSTETLTLARWHAESALRRLR
ncbi:SRPBCC family protein [Streptomyces sp. NPDC127077]|uniref:SRPBCC family protein n=1 Tax=Streptomyces sp. NPDC127077 TaxID=3347131 RepID=UPI00365B4B88